MFWHGLRWHWELARGISLEDAVEVAKVDNTSEASGMIPAIQKELRRRGFDLCHPIHTSWYNNLIREEGLVDAGTLRTLPETVVGADEGNNCNAILIGNNKHVWAAFLRWLATEVGQRKTQNESLTDKDTLEQVSSPFDTFVEESILQAIRGSFGEGEDAGITSCEMFWSNGTRRKVSIQQSGGAEEGSGTATNAKYHCYKDEEESFLVSMQRVAVTTGEYWLDSDATKLCVHPTFGTWTAFRTVVVFETQATNGAIPPVPSPCPCPVTDDELKVAKTVFDYALANSSAEEGYGTTVNKPWDELCAYLHGSVCSGSSWDKVPDTMKPWIQLRDCFSAGRKEWKYSEPQLLYHYTRDSEILTVELRRTEY